MRKDGHRIRNLSLAVVSCIILQACGQQSQYDSSYAVDGTSGMESSNAISQAAGINSNSGYDQSDMQNDYSYETYDTYEKSDNTQDIDDSNIENVDTDKPAITEEITVVPDGRDGRGA